MTDRELRAAVLTLIASDAANTKAIAALNAEIARLNARLRPNMDAVRWLAEGIAIPATETPVVPTPKAGKAGGNNRQQEALCAYTPPTQKARGIWARCLPWRTP